MICHLPMPEAVVRAQGAWHHEQHDLSWRLTYQDIEPERLRALLEVFHDGAPRRNVLVVMAERGLCPGPFRTVDRYADLSIADLEQAAGYVRNPVMRTRLLEVLAAREKAKR